MKSLDTADVREALYDAYDIVQELGYGGYGTVFQARERASGQLVALKVQRIAPGNDPHARSTREARFDREAALCAALDHPRIVRLLDKGRRGELFYIAFEYVPGETLTQLLVRRRLLPPDEAVALMSQLLSALAAAHARGIVHRDLKPDNLMVLQRDAGAELKVLDFGVAALEASSAEALPRLTLSREILGTPSYSAPEQLRGEPASARTDLYAWGLILLECLTGERVMDGATVAHVFHKQLSMQEVALPPALATHPLGQILRRALAKAPQQRAHDASQLLEQLSRVRLSDLVGELGREPPRSAPTLALPAQRNAVEQRQATVVSCNLNVVPRTGAAQDLEVLDAIQRDQLNLCRDVAARYGGYVAGSLGNRVLIVFGLPRASESDARRAGLSALALGAQVEARRAALMAQHGFDVELRLGIHTDSLIVGPDGAPSGPAINLAARLESLAAAGVTLVSRASYGLLHKQLRLLPVPEVAFATYAGPSEVFALVSGDTGQAPELAAACALVGRDRELDALLEHWARARAGAGSCVLLRGEPGIGKTRLARELRERALRAGAASFECQCLPEDRNTALHPVLQMLRRTFEPDCAAGAPARLSETLAVSVPDCADALAVLRQWLGWSGADDAPQLSGERQRELLLESLALLLCAGSRQGPQLVIVEDLQWADPTTRELAARMAELCAAHPVLILVTARPELTQHSSHLREIDLQRIEPAFARQLVAAHASGAELPAAAVASIVERADGVPLFIEELTRKLLEGSSSGSGGSSVPVSLRDLLTSRLDRLGSAKETAQLASAIGRDFELALLGEISLRPLETLQSDLASLAEAQILERRARALGDGYSFRHALIREAAWESMLPARRRAVHGAIAAALEAGASAVEAAHPARLAWHYELAGRSEKAVDQRLCAGQHAARASAYQEAQEHLQAGLALLRTLPESSARSSRELDLHNALGAVLTATQGFATEAVVDSFRRAEALLDACEPSATQRFATLRGLWGFHNARADYPAAGQISAQLLALADAPPAAGAPAREHSLVAHACACQTALLEGRYPATVQHRSNCEASFDPEAQHEQVARYGLDPWLTALSFECIAQVLMGNIQQAEQRLEQGFAATERLGSPAHEASLLGQAALVQLFVGGAGPRPNAALERCEAHAGRAFEIARRYGLRFAEGYAGLVLAMAAAPSGAPSAVSGLEQALQIWRYLGIRASISWPLSILAQGQWARRDYAAALASVREALAHCEQTGEGYGESEAQRTLGLLLGDAQNPAGDRQQAQHAYQRALEIARQQDARWLQLRAAYSFAKQLPQPRSREALASALSWFLESGQGRSTALVRSSAEFLSSDSHLQA